METNPPVSVPLETLKQQIEMNLKVANLFMNLAKQNINNDQMFHSYIDVARELFQINSTYKSQIQLRGFDK